MHDEAVYTDSIFFYGEISRKPTDPVILSRGEQVESGRIENVLYRQDVVEGAEYDGIGRGRDGSGGDVQTNAPGQDEGPGGRLSEQVEMGSIERDRKRQSDSDGSRIDGRRSWMDGAASGARYGSKQVGTRLLAGYQASQHGRYERNTSDVPGPSTPVPYYLR